MIPAITATPAGPHWLASPSLRYIISNETTLPNSLVYAAISRTMVRCSVNVPRGYIVQNASALYAIHEKVHVSVLVVGAKLLADKRRIA